MNAYFLLLSKNRDVFLPVCFYTGNPELPKCQYLPNNTEIYRK